MKNVKEEVVQLETSTFDSTEFEVKTNPQLFLPAWPSHPLPMGDGLLTQIERYANKYTYERMTMDKLRSAIDIMFNPKPKPRWKEKRDAKRRKKALGDEVQRVIEDYFAEHKLKTFELIK